MSSRSRRPFGLAVAAACMFVALVAAASAAPGPGFSRLNAYGASPTPRFGMARSANGALHLIYDTVPPGGGGPSTGLTTRVITPGGIVGPETPALTGWQPGLPGLTVLPNGTLEAVFGAISPAMPNQVSSIWSISSTDGGVSWTAPVDIASGVDEALAYGADMTLQASGDTPVLTAPQAGVLVVQQGFGAGSPTQLATDSSDNFAGEVNTAVDAASHEVVASWSSAAGSGGEWMRDIAPSLGAVQKLPGQLRNGLVISGRDTGSGVFAAYTPDNHSVRLARYGGSSIAVGSVASVTPQVLATATGLDGRIWVMWGDEAGKPGLVVTRSNKAVTRFEPLQKITLSASQLQRIGGDGRLGPLDLLVDYRPANKTGPIVDPGLFYARVLPELSATAKTTALKNKKGAVIKYAATVTVKDAGDPVSSAKAQIGNITSTTNGSGVATLMLPAASPGTVVTSVSKGGYQPLKLKVKL